MAKPKIYLVGGAVRDQLLGIKSKDLDYAVEAESFDAMRDEIKARGGAIFVETPKYFTIRAHVPELGASDFTLCRKDGKYTDGRHPDTVEIGNLRDDLARRDFTCNAIAIDSDTQEIIDPFSGQADIKFKTLRCVGETQARMNEDALRAYRAARFSITRNFEIEESLFSFIRKMRSEQFDAVSTERIREELFKMFSIDTRATIKLLTDDCGLTNLWDVALERGLWLKPTTESIK